MRSRPPPVRRSLRRVHRAPRASPRGQYLGLRATAGPRSQRAISALVPHPCRSVRKNSALGHPPPVHSEGNTLITQLFERAQLIEFSGGDLRDHPGLVAVLSMSGGTRRERAGRTQQRRASVVLSSTTSKCLLIECPRPRGSVTVPAATSDYRSRSWGSPTSKRRTVFR